MQTVNQQFVTNQVMNTTIISVPLPVNQLYGYAIQASFTATPTGTLKLQASTDKFSSNNALDPDGLTVPAHWDDITGSPVSVSAAGTYTWNVTGCFYNYVRLVFTDGSSGASTAVLNATFNGKY